MGATKRIVLALTATATLVAVGVLAPAASSQTAATLPTIAVDQLLDLARVQLPPAGVGLEIHADFPAEHPLTLGDASFTAVTATVTSDGTVTMRSAIPAAAQDHAQAGSGGGPVDECSDPAFAPTGRQWNDNEVPVEWYFDRDSVPTGTAAWKSQRATRLAHRVWSLALSRCTEQDRVSFDWDYRRETDKNVRYDNTNIIEFRNLDGALAINYTWYSGATILEVDLAFNKGDYRWTNRKGGKNRYQVMNVAAHELGHQIGLDDLSDPHGSLTMFGRIYKGEIKKTTLGQGDLRGAATLSP